MMRVVHVTETINEQGGGPSVHVCRLAEATADQGPATVEIAAFDEFSGLIGNPDTTQDYDHIILDTAPLLTANDEADLFVKANLGGQELLRAAKLSEAVKNAEAGLPPGVLNVVPCRVPEAEAILRRAIAADDTRSDAKVELSLVLTKQRRLGEAGGHPQRLLRLFRSHDRFERLLCGL